MKRLLRVLDEFWFPEAPAARLAMLRILIGGWVFCLLAADYSMWVKIGRSAADLFHPVGVVSLLSGPLPPGWNKILLIATLITNILFILGWRYRFTAPVFAVLQLWVISYRQSWSMIYHSMNLPVLHILILALSPAAAALSLDAYRQKLAGGEQQDPPSGWQYGFPIQLICTVTVLSYFVAGVAKVAGPLGFSWMLGAALRSQVAADTIRKEVLGDTGSPVFYWLYNHAWLFTVMGIQTFIVELGAPLALLNRRIGRVWAVLAFSMHWGILMIMGIMFRYHLSGIVYASFFDVERLPAWLRGLYDRRTARLVAAPNATTR